ncbi:non-specific lipid-transfer protein 3 [Dendrobium catenatum]|uniref:Non-specific lipid-transfer protein n=1 Tax=Dendrobium catenatum TaxID=906689 RepID=A0A2I0WVH6_9ASPA|nr:non-specific lipid-transfer protein 3 [Dendrobium catenatum]PKU79669.1 Non-specific lipid-transfer protein [Dendrobium catenatum]
MAANASIALITLLALATAAAAAAAAPRLSCSDAVSALIPCGSFLIGSAGNFPTKECCQSAQELNKAAARKADRQTLCKCLEQLGPSFGVKPAFARRLPVYCKLQLTIPISTNANCSQV